VPINIDWGNSDSFELNTVVPVGVTAQWYVAVFLCGENASANVTGTIAWRNAYGYVKAGYFRLLPFYLVLAILYIVSGLIFFGLCVYFRREILRVQLGIAGVFALGMCESFSWYSFYRNVNDSGYYPDGATIFGVLFTVAKATISRTLVLFVCMGLGVTKLSVGTTKYKVFALAMIFTIATCVFEVDLMKLETDRDVRKNDQLANMVIYTAVSLCNVIFLWWIFVSLVRTTHQLSLRRQEEKLLLFKRLLYVLGVTAIVFVVILLFYAFLIFVQEQSDLWKRHWIFDLFSELGFFILLLILGFLWRPNSNNTRYGLAELVDSGDDTTIQLQSLGGELTQRVDSPQVGNATQYENDREKNIKETSNTSAAELQMIETIASFTLNEEDEEDQVALAKGKLD